MFSAAGQNYKESKKTNTKPWRICSQLLARGLISLIYQSSYKSLRKRWAAHQKYKQKTQIAINGKGTKNGS